MPPSDTENYTARTFPVFPGDNPRERLLESLREELLGPSSEEEQLDISPKVRYLVGMLSPGGSTIEGIEDEQNLAQGEGEGNGDAQINLGISLEASSIGLSVVIDDEVNEVNISATWGEYFQVSRDSDQEEAAAGVQDTSEELSDLAKAREVAASQITPEESVDDLSGSATKGRFEKVWQRLPKELNFNLVLDDDTTEGGYAENGIGIRYLIKPLTGARVVSIFLVNERLLEPGQKPSVQEMIFQSKLHINGNNHPFLPRHNSITQLDPDPDIQSAELIYRKRHEFGVGHGVAANWISETEGRALSVWTDILPSFEVSKVTPRESEILDMDSLGIEILPEVTDRLQTFLNEYGQWLDVQEREAETIEGPLRRVADAHVQLGRNSLERMESGVSILQNESAFSAFQFANQAMALQRRRSVQVLQKQQGKEVQPDAEIAARWRPFQMGFVLQNLQGLVDRTHDDRQIADLLWFPTGGGKTEAYLGLTAFIFAFRRLEPIDGFTPNEGTAVIMRYTLRLLTIQQFQRALTLTASCEFLRTQNLELWGEERFTIGLWVGQSVTPNSYKDAKNALSKLKNGEQVYEKSPYQVLFCPWCGEDLAPQNYVTDDESERVLIHCWNPGCYLETSTTPSGIPALLVDQEIYRHPPSLLLATVDKFAQMAHNGRVQTLFGRVECHCPRHGWLSQAENHPSRHAAGIDGQEVIVTKAQTLLAPPELIIQDELHLISGPLGTLVGIYETAVDSLCAYKLGDTPIYPKVIASTATVRRAERQVRNLFDREVSVFPPQGLNSSDSFFAQESETDPGRLYVGVFGPGKSIKTTLVRTYASLLGRA
ncbi:MAG: hypothetical protein HOD39_13855, partial [Verrucomicrobia bacterium]|nr:hypothetical protein [Verrucomicrobiota bacterium]